MHRPTIGSATERDIEGPRILIVEDVRDDALRLQGILSEFRDPATRARCDVDVARSTEAARAYLSEDLIDIYIVDLVMIENDRMHDDARAEFGKSLVQDIATKSNAGLIVHSSLPPERESPDILEIGADDYIWKYPRTTNDRIPEIIRARVGSLWRRIQATRPKTSHLFAHRGRVFDVGGWRFTVGDRTVVNEQGQSERLSPTEYSLLQYACVIDGHEVDAEMFAQQVLRKEIGEPFRLDNLKYRLGRRLHDALIWRADGDGNYTLINVNELKPGVGKRTH